MKAASSAVLIHLFHSVPDVSILRDSRRWSGPVGGLRSRIITFEDSSDRVDPGLMKWLGLAPQDAP